MILRKNEMDLCNGPLFGNIIRFTVPIILMNALQLLYNAADMIVVGRYNGEAAVAAVGATATFISLIVNVFIGFSIGINVCISNYIGAKKNNELTEGVSTSVILAVISGLLVALIGILSSAPLLRLMGTPDDIFDMSLLYVRVYFLGAPANMLYNFISAILRAKGDTKRPLYILAASGLINVILNCVFVAIFDMSVFGVALATIISQYVSALLCLVVISRECGACRLDFKHLTVNKQSLVKMISLGLPSGIQGSVFSLSAMVIQSAINSFDTSVVAGNTAAGNIDTFSYIAFNAFQATVVTFVAQNYGAKNMRRVERSYFICICAAVSVAIVSGWTIYAFGDKLLSIYLPGEEAAISYGIIRLKYICIPYFLLAMMDVTVGVLRGLGCSLGPTVISMLGACGIRLLWIFTVFAKCRSLDILYLSFPLAWLATFVSLFVMYLVVKKKRDKDLLTIDVEKSVCCEIS